MKTANLLKYGTIAIGAVSATVIVLNYINDKAHKDMVAELTALQLADLKEAKERQKADMEKNFRNFTPPIDITASLPTKASGTAEWCLFFETMTKRYGKPTAELLFVKAWEKRRGSKVDAVEVKKCTGLQIDTTWWEQTLAKANKLADTGFNTFESNFKFVGTTPKVLFWGGIGVGIVILGVVAYKAITTKPDQAALGEGLGFGLGKSLKGGL